MFIIGWGIILGSCSTRVRIVDTFPGDGEEISAMSKIGVEFSTPMDRASVERRMRIDPEVLGEITWDENWMWFRPFAPFAPGQDYVGKLEAGAEAKDGNSIVDEYEWSFRVREPILIYISTKEGMSSLESFDLTNGSEAPLVTGKEIIDFAPANDGLEIALVIENALGGSDLWLFNRDDSEVNLLLDCGPDRCTPAAWSPPGNRLAYSREISNANMISGFDPPRLWTADPYSGQTSELMHDDHHLVGQPSWSPDGRRLAFYDRNLESIRVLDLETGAEDVLSSGFGLIGGWAPDGNQMVIPVLSPHEDHFFVSLQIVDLRTKETRILVDEGVGWQDVGIPKWSPDGEWILIGVQSGELGSGRQLWLLRPDGTMAQMIDLTPGFTHGGYHWDSSSEHVVYQRFQLDEPEAQPEVMLWEFGGSANLIAEKAWLPNWLQ